MKNIPILLVSIFLFSCSQEKVKSKYSFTFTDSSYARLTDDNIDEIIGGYVKGNLENVLAYTKIKKQGEPPYLLLIFKQNDAFHFHSVKKVGNSWEMQWGDSLNLDLSYYLAVSDWKIKVTTSVNDVGKYDTGALLTGCFPHDCGDRNGVFYYSVENEAGYVALFSEEENFNNFYPFGLPKDYPTLEFFEYLIYENNTTDEEFVDIKKIERNIISLPTNRILQQSYKNRNNVFNQVADKIMPYLNNSINNFTNVILFDFNSDNYLDFVFIDSRTKFEGFGEKDIFLFSGRSKKTIEFYTGGKKLINDFGGETFISYQKGEEIYIVIIFHNGGSSGEYLSPYLFKFENSSFNIVEDDELLTKIMNEFSYEGVYNTEYASD